MIRIASLVLVLSCTAAAAQAPPPDDMARRVIERRAIEATIWGVPAVNFELMHRAAVKAGGDWNQVVYWSRLPSWKNQTLTPNPDVIYLMPFYDTRREPMVLEIPPANGGSITGSVDDGWQTAIEDVGPAGVDKGNGGKYLILPPGYGLKTPEGYIPLRSSTYTGYALLRSNIGAGTPADIAKAVAYGRKIKFYPFAAAANPSVTKFVDVVDVLFDSTIPYDTQFFEVLNDFVQREPWIERDKAMIDTLRTVGIDKRKTFAPDAGTTAALQSGIAEAHAWLNKQYEATYFPPYVEGSRWALPVSPAFEKGIQSNYSDPNSYPVDSRGTTYTFGFFSAKHLGAGQFYLFTINDKAGMPLDGGRRYRLTVPPNAPVKLYWSAVAYDRETHAMIRDQSRASRASNSSGLKRNADGSVDIYFGPDPPDGQDSNWVPVQNGHGFEVLFRFYGPEKPLFDKTWRLPDLELVN